MLVCVVSFLSEGHAAVGPVSTSTIAQMGGSGKGLVWSQARRPMCSAKRFHEGHLGFQFCHESSESANEFAFPSHSIGMSAVEEMFSCFFFAAKDAVRIGLVAPLIEFLGSS